MAKTSSRFRAKSPRTLPMPARLRQRGIQPDAWRQLTDAQRRDVIRTSDELARPEATRLRNVAERARRLASVPESERSDWWHKYNKGKEERPFWDLYQVFAAA